MTMDAKRLGEIEHWGTEQPSCDHCDRTGDMRKHSPLVCPRARPPSARESAALAAEVRDLAKVAAKDRERFMAAIAWLTGRDCGISSQAICLHMLGCPPSTQWGPSPPADSDDVGRCVRLLRQPFAEGWVARLDEMVKYGWLWESAARDIRRDLGADP